jgi:predicted phage terminase large subunit-like protein
MLGMQRIDMWKTTLEYPDLKRAVSALAARFGPSNILIEDKASGTQLIQELQQERVHAVTRYDPKGLDKIMRLHSVTSTIENGSVDVPEKAEWLQPYLHELTTFPYGKHDDQADSTSQALDWAKQSVSESGYWKYLLRSHEKQLAQGERSTAGGDKKSKNWSTDLVRRKFPPVPTRKFS